MEALAKCVDLAEERWKRSLESCLTEFGEGAKK